MDLFEYIAIAISLVYSFTVDAARLGPAVRHSARPDHWVHLLLLLAFLLWVANAFWAFWSYHDAEWTNFRYILALAGPAAQYYVAVVFVPNEPAEVTSRRDHYFSARRRLWIAFGVAAVLLDLNTIVLVGMPVSHPARLGTLGNLVAVPSSTVFATLRIAWVLR